MKQTILVTGGTGFIGSHTTVELQQAEMCIRDRGPKGRRVYVQCVNHDKGAVAKKACSVACIGCGKCQKMCIRDSHRV